MTQACKYIPQNADFELLIGNEGQMVRSRTDPGFEFLFKSAKANFGVKSGKYMYEVKIVEFTEPEEYYGPGHRAKQEFSQSTLAYQNQQNHIRIGWSSTPQNKHLGTDATSCGYDNFGLKHYGGSSRAYGATYAAGDVIRCCIEFGIVNNISFYKNGEFQGNCYDLQQKVLGKGWFPAISLRNVVCEFNFGNNEGLEFFPIVKKEEGIEEEKEVAKIANKDQNSEEKQQENKDKIETEENNNEQQKQQTEGGEQKKEGEEEKKPENSDAATTNNVAPIIPPLPKHDPKKHDITTYQYINLSHEDQREYFLQKEKEGPPKLILMVGLPSSGKTTFAEQYVAKHPNTIHLSTQIIYSHIIQNIRIQSPNQKIILLMELCDEIFVKLMKLCAYQNKDIIIDQCNVLLRSRLEKLSYFKHHQNEAVVLIISDLEQNKRQIKKEKRSERYIPRCGIQTLSNLKENFVIPTESEGFARVHFVELEEDQARKALVLGCEISELQVHPLFRKKNFKEIDEFKEKNGITKNNVNFRELEEKKKRLEMIKIAEEKLKKQKEELAEKKKIEAEKKAKQQAELEEKRRIAKENGEELPEDLEKKSEEKVTENHEKAAEQVEKISEGQPKPPLPIQPAKEGQEVAGVSQTPYNQNSNGYNQNGGNRQNAKYAQKQQVKNNGNFNRLQDKQQEKFPYSQQPQQQGGYNAQQYPQQPPYNNNQQQYPPQQQYPAQQQYPPQQYPQQQQPYPQQQPPTQGGYYGQQSQQQYPPQQGYNQQQYQQPPPAQPYYPPQQQYPQQQQAYPSQQGYQQNGGYYADNGRR